MIRRYLAALAAFAALQHQAAAQPVSGLYVGLGAGADFLQNEIVKPADGFGPTKRSYKFDPGLAVAGSLGYGLGNGLRVEVEGDYADNHVRGVKLGAPQRAGGSERQYGGFLDVLYDLNLRLPVVPYVGLGAGYQEVALAHINSGPAQQALSSGGTEQAGAFAYQALAGLAYPVGFAPGLSLTAEYRFIGVLTPPAYDRGNGSGNTLNGVPLVPRATFSNIFNHEILFGVRYAFESPQRLLAPPQPLPPAPAAMPARSYLVFFDWDRADLTDVARRIIMEAAQASTHVQHTRIEVQGNADRSGTPAYNQRLSLRRAQTVAAELVRQGISTAAIAIQAFGDTKPLVPTAEGVREPQNRRVTIILR